MKLKLILIFMMALTFISRVSADDFVEIVVPAYNESQIGIMARAYAASLNNVAEERNSGIIFKLKFLPESQGRQALQYISNHAPDSPTFMLGTTDLFSLKDDIDNQEINLNPIIEIANSEPQYWINQSFETISTWRSLLDHSKLSGLSIALFDYDKAAKISIQEQSEEFNLTSNVSVFDNLNVLREAIYSGDVDVVVSSSTNVSNIPQMKIIKPDEINYLSRIALYDIQHGSNDKYDNEELIDSLLQIQSQVIEDPIFIAECKNSNFNCDELLTMSALQEQYDIDIEYLIEYLCVQGTKPCKEGCCLR